MPTTDAHNAYERHRHRQRGNGTWQPFVDAEPVRAHARALMAAGMGWRTVAARSGLALGVVNRLLYGGGRRVTSRRVRVATAAAILAVRPDLESLAPTATTDGTGTRRRLSALVAIGHTQTYLAGRLDMSLTNLGRILHSETRVLVSTARATVVLYDELALTPGPSRKARQVAAGHGWASPLAWDDERIDDPAAKPIGWKRSASQRIRLDPSKVERACGGERLKLTPAEKDEAIRRLNAAGLNDRKISERIGLSARRVQSRRSSMGLPAITQHTVAA